MSCAAGRCVGHWLSLLFHWSTFAGEYSEIYEAIIRQRCVNDGLGDDEKTLAKYFRLHLNRGINHYSTRDVLKNCSDLLKSALPKEEA